LPKHSQWSGGHESKLTSDLFAVSGSGHRCKVRHVPRVFGGYPRNIVSYQYVLGGIKNNTKAAMRAAAASRWNAGGTVIDLTLEDLEGSIRRFSNDLR
jgi:hypothetical protein